MSYGYLWLLVMCILFHPASSNNSACSPQGNKNEILTVGATIIDRLSCLRRIGLTKEKRICPKDGLLITGVQSGRTGNVIMAMIHALWLSDPTALNVTVVAPAFMLKVINNFHNESLLERFSITDNVSELNIRYQLTDKEIFNLAFFNANSLSPNSTRINLKRNYQAIQTASFIWNQALALLWSDLKPEIIDAAVWF
jgi:hypothetical protein